MFNPYVIRRHFANLLVGTLPLCAFVYGVYTFGLNNAIFIGASVLLVCMIASAKMTNHEFRDMLEGKGIITVKLESTGVFDFRVLQVANGRIFGNLWGKNINEPYNPELLYTLYAPEIHDNGYSVVKYKDAVKNVEKDLLVIDIEKFRRYKFGFKQYPMLVYNSVTKTLLTKGDLGDIEKMIASHNVFVANERAKDLNRSLLDFSRAVVDKEFSLKGVEFGKWLIYLLIGGIIAFFVWQLLQGGGGAISNAIGNVADVGGNIVNPVG